MGGVKERVTGVVLYCGDAVLLQYRDDRPDIRFPNTWAIFGGMVEDGESAEDAARREIEEELGLRLTGALECIHVGEDGDRHRTYFAAPLMEPLESLELREGQGMALLTAADLRERPVVPLHYEVITTWLASRA